MILLFYAYHIRSLITVIVNVNNLWPKKANTILPLIRGQGKRQEAIFLPGVLQVYQEPHRRYTTWIEGKEGGERGKGARKRQIEKTGTRFEYKPRFSLSGSGYRGMHREGRCLERVGIYYSVLFMLPISPLSLSSAPASLLSRYYSPFSTSTLSNCRLNSILRSCSHFVLVPV